MQLENMYHPSWGNISLLSKKLKTSRTILSFQKVYSKSQPDTQPDTDAHIIRTTDKKSSRFNKHLPTSIYL